MVAGLSPDGENFPPWKRFRGPGFILLAAAAAVAPQIVWGNSCGHDFEFHLLSWFDCLNAWRHGILYPHWAASANFGAGEPRFIFYPPLTWMLGAALGSFLPWPAVPIVLTFLLLAATGFATRALAREVLSENAATLAGCAALLSGYALFTAYERTAFPELSGGFWIPLLILFAFCDRSPSNQTLRRAFDGNAVPLALVLAGAWLSNVPVGIMAAYTLAALALASALISKSWAPLLRAATSTLLGLALAAVYILPVFRQQPWVSLLETTANTGYEFQNSWLFARHADPALAAHDAVLHQVSLIAAFMLFIAFAVCLVAWRRRTLPTNRWRILLLLAPCAILFLLLPISLPLWLVLPKLRFLQFPWRWLVVVESPVAILFAAAAWPKASARRWQRNTVIAATALFLLATALISIKACFQPCDPDSTVSALIATLRTGAGTAGADEYAPPDADNTLIPTGLPAACLVADPSILLGLRDDPTDPDTPPEWNPTQHSCQTTFSAAPTSGPENLRITAQTSRSGYLILRLRAYPAWSITLNSQPVTRLPTRDDGLIAVPIPEGRIDLAVDWTTAPGTIAGRCISLLAALLLTLLCVFERRLARPRLK